MGFTMSQPQDDIIAAPGIPSPDTKASNRDQKDITTSTGESPPSLISPETRSLTHAHNDLTTSPAGSPPPFLSPEIRSSNENHKDITTSPVDLLPPLPTPENTSSTHAHNDITTTAVESAPPPTTLEPPSSIHTDTHLTTSQSEPPPEPVHFSEQEIQAILEKVFSPLNAITNSPTLNTHVISPHPYRLIDYCDWCGWSDYKAKMTMHSRRCIWRKWRMCKHTVPRAWRYE